MRKKLTILGALTALTIGGLGIFQNSGTVSGAPIQTFTAAGLGWQSCYVAKDAGYPTAPTDTHPAYPNPDGGALQSSVCDGASIADPLPAATNVDTFTLLTQAAGGRLALPTTFTPSEWGNVAVACGAVNGNNECSTTTFTGNLTARVDLGCGIGGIGLHDVLAVGGSGGAITSWPDDTLWNGPVFTRTSQDPGTWGSGGGAPTGGDNEYVTDIVPFPASATFSSIDSADITSLYVGGSAPLNIDALKLQLASYESGYTSQAGLGMSVALLGGEPGNPPSDNTSNQTLPPDIQCLDSPQNTVAATNTLVTPPAGTLAVRWLTEVSAADLRDPVQDRILIWECRNTAGAPADGDGDCLTDGLEPDANGPDNIPGNGDDLCAGGVVDTDCDNDGVPDGVEIEIGGSVTSAQNDIVGTCAGNDGATDYDEIFQFTDPQNCDSDGDGQRDKQDLKPTNTCSDATAPFTDCSGPGLVVGNLDVVQATDDNCPNEANPLQENSDSNNDYHGKAGSTGDLTGTASHWTNPSEDILGDVCDTDDDNDALPDVSENPSQTVGGGTTIGVWRLPGAPPNDTLAPNEGPTLCRAPNAAGALAPAVPLLPKEGDSDNDLVLDGRECQFRSRPDSSAVVPAACPAGIPIKPAAAVAGCGQPSNSLADPCKFVGPPAGVSTDLDGDGLCIPRAGGLHENLERQFRTRGINTSSSTQVDDTDGCGGDPDGGGPSPYIGNGDSDADSDNDTIGAVCADPGSGPATTFTGIIDGDEVLFYDTSPTQTDSDRDGCMDGEEIADVNGTGNVNSGDQLAMAGKLGAVVSAGAITTPSRINFDLDKSGAVNSGDQLLQAKMIGASGGCTPHPVNGVSVELDSSFGSITKP